MDSEPKRSLSFSASGGEHVTHVEETGATEETVADNPYEHEAEPAVEAPPVEEIPEASAGEEAAYDFGDYGNGKVEGDPMG